MLPVLVPALMERIACRYHRQRFGGDMGDSGGGAGQGSGIAELDCNRIAPRRSWIEFGGAHMDCFKTRPFRRINGNRLLNPNDDDVRISLILCHAKRRRNGAMGPTVEQCSFKVRLAWQRRKFLGKDKTDSRSSGDCIPRHARIGGLVENEPRLKWLLCCQTGTDHRLILDG